MVKCNLLDGAPTENTKPNVMMRRVPKTRPSVPIPNPGENNFENLNNTIPSSFILLHLLPGHKR